MAVTESTYTGNGSTTNYSFTFPYLKTTDIKASINGTATTAFTLANATTVQFNTAPANSSSIRIYRETDDSKLEASFFAGSSIKSSDLNDNFNQTLYVTQESNNKIDAAWTSGDETIDSSETWASNNTRVATTGAIDGRIDSKIDTALTTDVVGGQSITITDNSPGSGQITASVTAGSIRGTELAADAVDGTKIADDSINSEHYVDGSIDTAHIADAQVTTAKVADSNITTAKIANNAITSAKILDDAVSSGKIATGAITTDHLETPCVTTANITDSNVTTNKLAAAAVVTSKLGVGAVTNEKLAADAVDSSKLADNSVNSEHYVDGSIDTAHIADGQVTTAKIAADAIDGTKLADNAVNTEHLATNSVTTDEIADAELTTLAGMQSATASILAANTNLTATIAEINAVVDGKSVETTISDTDAAYPTSGAVVDYVAAQIAPLGGLEVIANEDSFPTTQPQSGVVISIADAGGIVVNGSGVSTTARTSGNGSDNVTINGFPSTLYSTTLTDNMGLLVSSTGSSNTYTYHKLLGKESDIKSLSDDINDFNNRYRVAASAPSSSLDDGDLWFDTTNDKMKVYNATGSSWDDVATVGDFFINTLSSSGNTGGGSATFNGTAYRFVLSSPPTSAQQLIVSVNGVIQKPNAGSSQPSEGFAVSGNDIIFSAAPPSGADYFITTQGSAVSIGTPSDNTVSTAKLQNLAVTGDKIATNLDLADNKKIRFGTGNDLELYHDGDDSYLINTTGTLMHKSNVHHFRSQTNENMAKFAQNGAVELYYDNVKKLETKSDGVIVSGALNVAGQNLTHAVNTLKLGHEGSGLHQLRAYGPDASTNGQIEFNSSRSDGTNGKTIKFSSAGSLEFPDNQKVILGTGDDLQLYHDGSNSFIRDVGTGVLHLDTNGTKVQIFADGTSSKTMANFHREGAVELYYDGSKKFETVSTGVYVYGDVGVGIGGTGNLFAGDSRKLQCGNGNDLQMYHDGTNTYFENLTGNVYFRNDGSTTYFQMGSSNDTGISISKDDTVQLYFDDNSQLRTTATGVVVGDSDHADSNLRVDHEDNTGKGRVEVNAFGLANIQLLSNFSGSAEHGVPNGAFGLTTPQSRDIHFCTAGTSRMTIASDGTWRYNTSSDSPDTTTGTGMAYSSSKFRVSRSADPCAAFNRANSTGDVIQLNYNGTQRGSISTDGTVIAFNTSSDYRLKENEVAISDGITRLKTLKPYRFNFISNPSKTVDGFFAHEVTAVPEAITGEKDGDDMQGMDYSKLTPLLTAALQEAITKIETLETKVAALEAK